MPTGLRDLGGEVAGFIRGVADTRISTSRLREMRMAVRYLAKNLTACEHENGFHKATLWQSEDGAESLRIHIWMPGEVTRDSNIHNHGWDFVSVILLGGLRQEIYRKGDGRSFDRFIYRAGLHYDLEPSEHEALLFESCQIYHCGDSYRLPSSALHRISPLDAEGAITLVLTERRRPGAQVDVYAKGRRFVENRITTLESIFNTVGWDEQQTER